MIKRIFFTISIFLLTGFLFPVFSQDDKDEVVDPKCTTYLATAPQTLSPRCNPICERGCLYVCAGGTCGDTLTGNHCESGSTDACTITDSTLDAYYSGTTLRIKRSFNLFDVELCPDPLTRPPDDPYCVVNLIRLGFYGVISFLIFILVLIALWVVWVRSTAADSPEKVEKAASIARNAIVGALITFLFIAIVQVVSLLVGLTGNIFDITIVPQPTILNSGDQCSGVGYVQCPAGTECKNPGGTTISYCF
jgi:hypothetical protein